MVNLSQDTIGPENKMKGDPNFLSRFADKLEEQENYNALEGISFRLKFLIQFRSIGIELASALVEMGQEVAIFMEYGVQCRRKGTQGRSCRHAMFH
jgi:hypothetical protein